MTEELVERCREELKRQMEAQADDTTPSSIQRAKGLVWLDGWFDLTAIIPIVRADALEEAARVADRSAARLAQMNPVVALCAPFSKDTAEEIATAIRSLAKG